MSPSRTSSRGRSSGLRFLVRLVGWSFSAAIALVVLSYVALPAALRYGLPHALARYGLVSSVEGARVKLMDERVTLVGFQLGQAGGPAIRWGEVEARVDLAELLKGNIRIIDFQVKDARVDLEQLRASKWKPPESAAAIPELGKLNIDIGNVVLRDLEFIGLSERSGLKVGLRSLSLGSLSHLEAGTQVAFQLEGFVGDGSLRLAGRAQIVDGLPVLEGRYEAGALDLSAFGALLDFPEAGSLGGNADGNGTFELAYLQGDGEVHAKMSGNARLNGLELDSGDTSIAETVAEWNGDAEVFWQLAAGPPRVIARGSVASPALRAVRRTTAGLRAVFLGGFRWSGELRHGGELETEGELSSDLLRVDTGPEGIPQLDIAVSSLSATSRFRSGRRGYEFETGELVAESVKLNRRVEGDRQSLIAHRLLLEEVRLSSSGHRIGNLKAESAEAMLMESAETTPSGSARFISIGAEGIEIQTSGAALIHRLEVEHAGMDSDQHSLNLSQVRAARVEVGANAPLEAEELSASSLRQRTGVLETWGSNLRFSAAGVFAGGEVFSAAAAAASLSQTAAGDPLWEASAVSAADLSIGAKQIEASKLSADRFAYGKFGATLIEIDGGEGTDFSLQYDSGIVAGSLTLESVSYRSGRFSALELVAAELRSPAIGFQGELSAENFEAAGVGYSNAGADRYRLETVKLGELSGSFTDELRIEAAYAGQLSHDRAAGPDYRASGLELSRMVLSGAGGVSAIAGRLHSLEVALADGARLTLEDAVAANPGRNGGGRFDAAGGRIRALVYTEPGGPDWRLVDLQFGVIDSGENEDHRIELVSAAGVTASDPGVEGEFKTGALQLVGVGISSDGKVRADVASASSVSLAGYQGNPPPAFSSARMDSRKLVLEPGWRLQLGEVLLDDSRLTMGLNGDKKLVLPHPPFFSAGSESFGGIAIERLETRRPARVTFIDQSTAPPFKAVIAPLQARLANFRSNDPGQRAKFTLDGGLDEASRLEAAGEFSIDRDGLNLQMSGKVAAMALERFDAYVAKAAHRAIRSGRGDAVFDLALGGRKLTGAIGLVFSGLEFESGETPAAAEARQPQGLSLENSMAMLEDNEGEVRLTVPLSGSLDDPGFHFGDVVLQALSRTLRSSLISTFEPLGLNVDSAYLELRPVAFGPGEHRLSQEGLAHLDVLARTLNGHPAVELRVCGRAVSADRIRIEQRRIESVSGTPPPAEQAETKSADVDALLHGLAQQRAATVRRYLEQDKAISRQRLIHCEAKVESIPGRLPRVDLPVDVKTGSNAAPREVSQG